MAKRKRSKFEKYTTNLGLPEVDRIIDHLRFKRERSSPTIPNKNQSTKKEFIRFKLGRHRENFSSSTIPIKVNHQSHPKKDVISKLPDEILQFIISTLNMREGATTCILSRRWRSLWSKSVSRLNFDIPTMLGHNYPKCMFRDTGRGDKESQDLLNKISYEFTQLVDRVMHHRSASRLDSLRVSFMLNKGSASRIDRWIKSAVSQGVTDMELDFSVYHFNEFPCVNPRDFYEFPTREDAPSLKYLRLKFCIFHLPCDFTGFASLISLSLNFIEVSQCFVDNILSNCPLLECLSLTDCCYLDTKNLTFSGPSLLLKHLHIANASNVEKIEVHDVNLISLELLGCFLPNLSLKNAPHLARLVLFASMHVETLSNIPRLEIFLMQQYVVTYHNSGPISQRRNTIPPPSVFCNLKRLVIFSMGVKTSFLEVVRILETCPSLQELELNISSLPTPEEELAETMSKLTMVPRIHHNNLKEVEIYGFKVCPLKIAFTKYLLNYAATLGKMKIYTTKKVYHGNGNWTLHEGLNEEVESLEEVHKQLQKIVCSSSKLELSCFPNP